MEGINRKLLFFFFFRWKRTSAGVMLDGGKKVLEFVAIQRKDNSQWAIPGVSGKHIFSGTAFLKRNLFSVLHLIVYFIFRVWLNQDKL